MNRKEDLSTYTIHLSGMVTEAEINALSPIHAVITHPAPAATCLQVVTDQSGLLGLLAYLHGMGLMITKMELHSS